jgi:hypothetical protein
MDVPDGGDCCTREIVASHLELRCQYSVSTWSSTVWRSSTIP